MKSFSLTQHLHKRLTNNEASDDYAKDRYAKQKPQPRKLHPKEKTKQCRKQTQTFSSTKCSS